MTDPMLILAQGRMYDFRDQVAAGRLRRQVRRSLPRRPPRRGTRSGETVLVEADRHR